MDARGLVAFIVTVHELALVLALLVGALIGVVGLLLLRNVPLGRRLATVVGFALGSALVAFAVTSHLASVSTFDVEVVRLSD